MPDFSDNQFSDITILVVDDQDYVRAIITQLLKRLGVGTVVEASGGTDAFEMLNRIQPDIVLCDVKMEPVDGLDVLRDVRNGKTATARDVPIIFLTSASDRTTVQTAMDNAVDGYLVKPVSAEELRMKLKAVLARRQQ